MEPNGIEALLSHQKPWILVDKIIEIKPEAQITAIKYISTSDYFIQGHFPHLSIYPGVLLVEGVRQCVEILFNEMGLFQDLNARFLKPVYPGSAVIYKVSMLNKDRGQHYHITANAYVGESKVLSMKSLYLTKK